MLHTFFYEAQHNSPVRVRGTGAFIPIPGAMLVGQVQVVFEVRAHSRFAQSGGRMLWVKLGGARGWGFEGDWEVRTGRQWKGLEGIGRDWEGLGGTGMDWE
jgi:hypothetical protein